MTSGSHAARQEIVKAERLAGRPAGQAGRRRRSALPRRRRVRGTLVGKRVGGYGRRAGDRPVDVCIVNRVTGAKLPCELSYAGIDDEGLHEWQVGTPFDPETEKLTIGVLPPRTTLSWPMLISEDGDE